MWCVAHPNVRPRNVVQNWYVRHVSPKNERLSCRVTLMRFLGPAIIGSMADVSSGSINRLGQVWICHDAGARCRVRQRLAADSHGIGLMPFSSGILCRGPGSSIDTLL
jgi:hypothetical protein